MSSWTWSCYCIFMCKCVQLIMVWVISTFERMTASGARLFVAWSPKWPWLRQQSRSDNQENLEIAVHLAMMYIYIHMLHFMLLSFLNMTILSNNLCFLEGNLRHDCRSDCEKHKNWFQASAPFNLSVNALTPGRCSMLFEATKSLNPAAAELILLARRWAKDRGISHAAKGHLSPYAWMLLAIYYLQALTGQIWWPEL